MVLSSTLGTMWDERISLADNFTGTVDGQSAPQNVIRNPTHAGPARPQPEHHVTVTSQNSESCRISNHHLCSTIDCRQETLGYRNDTGKAAVTSLQLVGLYQSENCKTIDYTKRNGSCSQVESCGRRARTLVSKIFQNPLQEMSSS